MAHAATSLLDVALDDKYRSDRGRVYLTGIQALARLPLMQHRRDKAAGLNTGGFISGYRGSPLGGLDQALWAARPFLAEDNIHFQPGVNEDLAATSVWGSQQTNLFEGATVDGVFALWYGKGPGVDRSGDVLKHANAAGTAALGGVLAVVGDDHGCKSSTFPHQSEQALAAAMIPVLAPAGVQDILDLGLYGWAMSRYAGVWVALKTVAETVDSSASVSVDPDRVTIRVPDPAVPQGGLSIRWPDPPPQQEERLIRHKLPAAQAFARANRLDRVVLSAQRPRLGIVAAGKAYLDVRQALDDLGIGQAEIEALGLALYKVAMPWPLEGEGLRDFARGLDEILVVEEKRALIEPQIRDLLYGAAGAPRITGKRDVDGSVLLAEHGEISPADVALALGRRLDGFDLPARLRRQLSTLAADAGRRPAPAPIERKPHYCSGCPHSRSTKVPEGSRAMAGIGCHYMSIWMDRRTETFTQMGGEGVPWIGQAPFTKERHVFANLGDGTYFHSGILAVRAAIAAGVNITYKLLYNDAVAMTGGQHVDGTLTVPQITCQLAAEGVARIVVVTDDLERYAGVTGLAPHTRVEDRHALETVERELREVPGVTVLVYDQTCAAEKRRRRKRGRMIDPPKRAFINEAVCEGCGDCSVQSSCLSVVPVDTEFGTKRQIDQSSCNKDFSCVDGFCPSFVTVHGGSLKAARPAAKAKGPEAAETELPEPALPDLAEPYGILVTGVGGTGVVTIGALLGMAAHLEGKGATVLDMTGLAQKGGAVTSHIRIAAEPDAIHAVRIAAGDAHAVLACDPVVAAGPDALMRMAPGVTRAVVNSHEAITAEFLHNPDFRVPVDTLVQRIADRCAGKIDSLDAGALATALFGDSIAANLMMLGFAYQRGMIPLSAAAIERAIELNGVAVAMNRAAFAWGRRAAHDPALVARRAGLAPTAKPAPSLEDLVERRARLLTDYQDAAYADHYRRIVETARRIEAERAPGRSGLAEAVATNLARLMAYKDEYEVARLFTDGGFRAALAARFEGPYRLEFHMAPPLLAETDPLTGRPRKLSFGPWMMAALRLLAPMKRLRGTRFDPFGRTAERRAERALIAEYEATLEELLAGLTPDNHALAMEIARLPERIRGYGPVKEAAIRTAHDRAAALLDAFRHPAPHASAAE